MDIQKIELWIGLTANSSHQQSTIFLDEYPVGADGRLFVLRVEVEEEWRKSRNELVELCGKKGLKVKILRYGEQCEFDV